MDVEPMGEDYVRLMCHDIEDPTFDATAVATNWLTLMPPCLARRSTSALTG
jgi:hypothetical protein